MASRMISFFVLAAHLALSLNAQQLDEYHVKAAFLYNFAKFVDWPPEAFKTAAEPFAICILGQDPFGRALDDVVAGKTMGGRPVTVRRPSDAHQAVGCQILFVSSSEHKQVLAILAAAKQPGVLTVGEVGNPTAQGVAIAFILEGGRVRFEVNLACAEEEKLRFSSKLLSLAISVRH
jgi:hypothetical protein